METEILIARINDTAEICRRTSRPKFLGFLTAEESILATKILEKTSVSFDFFGGYDDAERVMLGCIPEYFSSRNFPIEAITFIFRECDTLTHRDFLGSLMGLGLKRESIGDILIEKGRAVAFVSNEVSNYIISQLERVGRVGVEVKIGFEGELPQKAKMQSASVTVASERLDCIVSALASVSRNSAAQMILSGLVSINSLPCEKATKSINAGDAVTIRGKGKFFVTDIDGRTRKNRIILNYKIY